MDALGLIGQMLDRIQAGIPPKPAGDGRKVDSGYRPTGGTRERSWRTG